MDGAIIARVLHVLGVVLWIGGVAMVTTVLLPATKRMKTTAERVMFFETVERGFALQARITTLLTGLSGLYLVYQLDLWRRFAQIEFWWMHAMVLVWALFTLVLFVLEPLLLHRWLIERVARDPDSTFAWVGAPALGIARREPGHGRGRRGRQPRVFVVWPMMACRLLHP